MAEDLTLIRRFVASLIRRERWQIASVAAMRLGAVTAALVLLSVVASRGAWERSAALMVLVGLAAGGLWVSVWAPLLTRWRPAGDPMRQARAVERLRPELRGRLITALDGGAGGGSEALLGLVARRAAEVVRGVSAGAVHPMGHVWRALVVAMVAWLVALPSTFLAPGGPLGLLRFWSAGLDARAAVADLDVTVQEDAATVGDLVITYTYPDYTGLDPRRVENTTGDVAGPPGTLVDVVARSAAPVEAAGLVAYDQTFDAAVGEDGRELVGRFRIGSDAGTWRWDLYRGGEPESSRAFAIAPEPDLPPDVFLEARAEVIEVAVDEPFELQWRARDDYGVVRAVLSVTGTRDVRELYDAEGRRAEAFDDLLLRPTDLGLAPGSEADLQVLAWDNDTVSGSKVGTSRVIHLVVLGPQGRDARRAERHAELEAVMVPILARFLTERPLGPGGSAAGPGSWSLDGAAGAEILAWGEAVAARYRPLQDKVDELFGGASDDPMDRRNVNRVIASGRDLVRFTQVAFAPDGPARPAATDLATVVELRNAAITTVERALLAMLAEERLRALAEVSKKAVELDHAAEQLRDALSRENPDPLEMAAGLDRVEAMLRHLREVSASLDEGGLKAFVNLREDEMQGLLEEVRQAIAEGRMDDARRLMERLASQIDELAEGIRTDLEERLQQRGEAESEAKELSQELARLEKEQRELQQQVRELREQEDGGAAEDAARLWERIDTLTTEANAAAQAYGAGLEDAERPFYERERASGAVEAVEALRVAVQARDILGSREAVAEAAHQWIMAQRSAFGWYERTEGARGPTPAEAAAIEARLREIESLLDQLDRSADGLSADALQQAESIRDKQRDLGNRLESARQQAERVMQQLPVSPEGMPEALDEASERMGQAGEDLGRGRAMAAEGSQGVSAERLQRARSALDQAIDASSQQSQSGQGGESGGKPQGEDGQSSGDGDEMSTDEEIYIPGREAYESPEAYRKALLEGMQGEVPDAYRAWKKRYYEELVQQ